MIKTWLKFGILALTLILIIGCVPSPCLQLKSPSEIAKCRAEYENVNSLCKNIKDFDERRDCNTNYIKTETVKILQKDNIEYCKDLKGKAYNVEGLGHITGEEYCYYNFAIEKDDISLCEMLELVKGKCYRDFAEKNKDFSLCEQVDLGWGSGDFCKITLGLQIGRETKDITECDKIENERYKQACIFGVAETLRDTNICEMITINERIEAFNFNKEECLERIKRPLVVKVK